MAPEGRDVLVNPGNLDPADALLLDLEVVLSSSSDWPGSVAHPMSAAPNEVASGIPLRRKLASGARVASSAL